MYLLLSEYLFVLWSRQTATNRVRWSTATEFLSLAMKRSVSSKTTRLIAHASPFNSAVMLFEVDNASIIYCSKCIRLESALSAIPDLEDMITNQTHQLLSNLDKSKLRTKLSWTCFCAYSSPFLSFSFSTYSFTDSIQALDPADLSQWLLIWWWLSHSFQVHSALLHCESFATGWHS